MSPRRSPVPCSSSAGTTGQDGPHDDPAVRPPGRRDPGARVRGAAGRARPGARAGAGAGAGGAGRPTARRNGLLPAGIRLQVVEGHRSEADQRAIIARYSSEVAAAHPGIGAAELERLTSRFVAPIEVAPPRGRGRRRPHPGRRERRRARPRHADRRDTRGVRRRLLLRVPATSPRPRGPTAHARQGARGRPGW